MLNKPLKSNINIIESFYMMKIVKSKTFLSTCGTVTLTDSRNGSGTTIFIEPCQTSKIMVYKMKKILNEV